MGPQTHLLVTTVGYCISLVLVICFALFMFFQKPRKPMHLVFFFFCVAVACYQIAFIIGVNTPATSSYVYWVWFTNIAEDVFIALLPLHLFILATDGYEKFKNILKTMYVFGLSIIGASFIFPKLFIVTVVPKLYLLSYVDTSGPLYYIIDAYFLIAFALTYWVLFYERSIHGQEGKKRIDYYILGITFGFLTGVTSFAPDFNLPIDPGISALLGVFIFPLVYGMVKKGIMDIRLAIRKAVIVTTVIMIVAALFILVSLLSNWLIASVPGFGFWVLPLLVALILVVVGFLYYKREQNTEKLKYEFITVVAHKFRTPLTRIKWQTEDLVNEGNLSAKTLEGISQIKESALELISLSNLLLSSGRMEQENYKYTYKNIPLAKIVDKVMLSFKSYISSKHINFSIDVGLNVPDVYVDEEKLAAAVHVLVENAVLYVGASGIVHVQISVENDTVRFSITDNGIGIPAKDQVNIFTGFYRGGVARTIDTEGVGLGLSMAKSIIEHQGGSIGVSSAGEGKGSTFWFTLLGHKEQV